MEASLIILWFPSNFWGVNIEFRSPDPIRSFNSTKLILPKVFPPTFLNHHGPKQINQIVNGYRESQSALIITIIR